MANLRPFLSGSMIACLAAIVVACGQQREPPETTVSWLAKQTRAAKPPDCPMPTLAALPNTDYQQLAIIEITDDYSADNQEVLELAHRKACETGADALVIFEDKRQEEGRELPGTSASAGKGPPSGEDPQTSAENHVPEVGEEGHRGWFFNGVAIIYETDH
jgi:hypothetical protein